MADYVIERTHIIDHERFLEAGPHARDLWEWGLKYSGKHELDGAIPMSAVLASPWGYGGKANIKAAAKLVEVGLWARTDRGFVSLRWTEQGNKTHAQLEAAREVERKKKADQRNRLKTPCPPPCPVGTPEGTPAGVLNSTSTSSSGSSGSEIARDPPPWFGEALATVAMQTGETLRPADSWLRYSGHRAGKGIAINQQDAGYWLTTVMVREAREERHKATRDIERDAKFTAARAAGPRLVDTAPAPYHAPAKAHRRVDVEPPSREVAASGATGLLGALQVLG